MSLESKLYWSRRWAERESNQAFWHSPGKRKLKKGVLHHNDLGGMFPIRGGKDWNKCSHIRPNRAKQSSAMTKLLQIYNYNPSGVLDWYDTKLPIFPHKPHSYFW